MSTKKPFQDLPTPTTLSWTYLDGPNSHYPDDHVEVLLAFSGDDGETTEAFLGGRFRGEWRIEEGFVTDDSEVYAWAYVSLPPYRRTD